MRVVIVTVGSLGDVRPYVALGRAFMGAGHTVTLATHEGFRALALAQGLAFHPLQGDPRATLQGKAGRDWLRSPTPWGFSRRLAALMDPLLTGSMIQCADACRGAHLIVHSLLGWLVAHSVAERLGIPVLAAYLQPATPTGAFPALSLPLPFATGRRVNCLTHAAAERVFWHFVHGPLNRGRADALGLAPLPRRAPFAAARRAGMPILYGFSAAVVPKPADWRETDFITGYWTLDDAPRDSDATDRLAIDRFIAAGSTPVYVGFGSVGARDAPRTTGLVLDALRSAGLRSVIASGWGGLAARTDANVLVVPSVSHSWLFPLVAAVVHHGGAGTTAAGLYAGRPTLTIPQSAEQQFWGARIHGLGAGPAPLPAAQLTGRRLTDALCRLTADAAYAQRAQAISARLRREIGVRTAVELAERLLAQGRLQPPAPPGP